MDKYELDKTIQELNEITDIPGKKERALELAKALVAHYKGEDRKKDDKQLEIPFDKE